MYIKNTRNCITLIDNCMYTCVQKLNRITHENTLIVVEKVAMKIIDKAKLENKTQKMLAREICNMEKMHHPNIVRLYEVLETPQSYYLAMECASGGELFAKITNDGRMPEPEARLIFAQVASAIEHLVSIRFR